MEQPSSFVYSNVIQLPTEVYTIYWPLDPFFSLNPKKIEGINHLWKEIASLRVMVPLSMLCLYAGKLNADLCGRTERLKDKIILFEVEENRAINSRWEKDLLKPS